MYTITLAIRSTDPAPPRPKYETDDALEAYDITKRYCESYFSQFVPYGSTEARFTDGDVTVSLDILWMELDNGELTEWHCGPISVVCG